MRYQIEMTKTERKTIEVLAETPQEAIDKSILRGWTVAGISELRGDDDKNCEWEIIGRCEGCNTTILSPGEQYGVDPNEGVYTCHACSGFPSANAKDDQREAFGPSTY